MRRAGLDANPLRRGTDRAEAWIRLSVVVMFLVVGPLAAIAVGHWASDSGAAAARAQAAAEHRMRAVLLANAPAASSYPIVGSSVDAWVRARWTAPDGTLRAGEVQAAAGARAGSTVIVWSDASGTLGRLGDGLDRGRTAMEPAALISSGRRGTMHFRDMAASGDRHPGRQELGLLPAIGISETAVVPSGRRYRGG